MAGLLSGCVTRAGRSLLPDPPALAPMHAVIPEPALNEFARDSDYVDLRAGERLCVITPLLKSGGYEVKSAVQEVGGNTVTLLAADLEGYETAYYSVRTRQGGGVRIEFSAAEVTKDGATVPQPRPSAFRFEVPPAARLVRLLYLVRVSRADHDMAVISADEERALGALTDAVRARPEACRSEAHAFCSWVPRGIAVRPEQQDGAGGWVPVR